MSEFTFRERCRYRFDNFMARGGSSIFISLVVVFVVLLLVLGAARGVVHWIEPEHVERSGGFFRQLYQVFLHLMDPGTMAYDIDSSAMYKTIAVGAGLGGVVILSSLIAFITSALDQKLAALKKGHSRVVEEGHTLILGWNDRVVEVLRELVLANESESKPVVVILSETEKESMDDHLRLNLPDSRNTRIVTRSGNVASLANLEIAALPTAKSVIVLAPCGEDASAAKKAASDANVVKTILAVMASKPTGHEVPIVVELFSARDRSIVTDLSPSEITAFDAQDIMAKLLVQTSRSTGLSVVYGELLSFDGCEMYFFNDGWGGQTFADVQFHFPDGVPIGVRSADGTLRINPPVETVLSDDDDLLVVADDDSTLDYRRDPVATPTPVQCSTKRLEQHIERDLLIGWTAKAPTIIREYADYVSDGSTIDVLLRGPDPSVLQAVDDLNKSIDGLRVSLVDANPLNLGELRSLNPDAYDNIIILSQGRNDTDDETTDSETLIILLLLRKLFAENPTSTAKTRLVTELLDSDNRTLIAQAGVNDFIISNQLISMMLAQVSEEPDMKRVYDGLFAEDGSEIYLKPLSYYADSLPVALSFADMMWLAQQRGEVCIGLRLKDDQLDASSNFGVQLIPEKNRRFTLGPEDCLVVVSEDET